jgi:hypothetical protein
MTLRLRLWLAAMSITHRVLGYGCVYLWCVERAGAAVEQTPGNAGNGEEPF